MAAAVAVDIGNDVKLRFAEAFSRTKNASTAALQVIQGNPGLALKLSYELPGDPVVLAEMTRLGDEIGEEGLLPSKAQIAREIYDRAKLTSDPEDYERLMKLYCSVCGHIEKPGVTVNTNNTIQNVMVVTDHGTDDEWAVKAQEQQRKLTIDAAN